VRRALGFLTPFGGASVPSAAALTWFPVVGALIGLAVGFAWWLAAKGLGPFAAAAVAVAVDLGCTGLLHMDGLADTADGLLPHLDTERRLAVMAEPTIGAYGVTVVAATLLLRTGALASARPAPLAVAALWCASRTGMAVILRTVKYARSHGLALAFVDRSRQWLPIGAVGLGLLLALGWWERPAHLAAAVVALALAMAGVTALAVRRLGGFTGDVLGAAAVTGETIGLLVLVSRW